MDESRPETNLDRVAGACQCFYAPDGGRAVSGIETGDGVIGGQGIKGQVDDRFPASRLFPCPNQVVILGAIL